MTSAEIGAVNKGEKNYNYRQQIYIEQLGKQGRLELVPRQP